MVIRQNLTNCPDYFDELQFWRNTILTKYNFDEMLITHIGYQRGKSDIYLHYVKGVIKKVIASLDSTS